MTLPRARALIEAAHSASDAPWRHMPTPNRDSVLCESGTIAVLSFPDDCKHKENAAFIALSRNDAPAIALALIEKHRALEEAEARIAALEAALRPFAKIEVPRSADAGTWVARTLHCNDQVTAHSVWTAREALGRHKDSQHEL